MTVPDSSLAFNRPAWLAALSMVLNALWLLVTQAGWLWLSVVVIVVLLWACATLVTRLTEEPSRSLVCLLYTSDAADE